MKAHQTISIREYEAIGTTPCRPNGPTLSEKNFECLKTFCIEEQKGRPALLRLAVRNGQEVIVAQNYVGVITFADGVALEILPKITDDDSDKTEDIKKLFYAMISSLPDIPSQIANESMLATQEGNLWEVFLAQFLRSVGKLIASGLISQYITKEENLSYYRGKILFARHIKQNLIHQERLFVAHDIFHVNCLENQIIKKALLVVMKKAQTLHNQINARRHLDAFARVDRIPRITRALRILRSITPTRENRAYRRPLQWAKLILECLAVTQFAGKKKALALLFPAERLFESYVAMTLRKYLQKNNHRCPYQLFTQDRSRTLFDDPKCINLRPDLVLYQKSLGTRKTLQNEKIPFAILDTKWKQFNGEPAPSDLYQMIAYQSAYGTKRMVLLYPSSSSERKNRINTSKTYRQNKNAEVIYGCYALDLFALEKDTRWKNFLSWLTSNPNSSNTTNVEP